MHNRHYVYSPKFIEANVDATSELTSANRSASPPLPFRTQRHASSCRAASRWALWETRQGGPVRGELGSATG